MYQVDLSRKDMFRRYYDLCQSYDREFARNRVLHGDRIRCGPGCADCCHQLFQITELEAAEISRGVRRLPEDVRQRLEQRARSYLPERASLVSRSGTVEAWGELPPPGKRLPCPALNDDGECSIYDHRPLICRKFGIPLWNPDRPGRVYACALNFKPGEEIEDGELIQIQTELFESWKSVQRDYTDSGRHRDQEPLTVARAILEDCSSWDE